jgi:hemerythrin superfamily protein
MAAVELNQETIMAMDPFGMLETDHRQVERLLEQLADSEPGAQRTQLVGTLTTAFEAHAGFEEREVYPFVAETMGDEKRREADIEHGLAREGISKLSSMTDEPGFGAAVEMLKGGIGHHVEEEEGELFPKLRRSLDDDTRDRLAESLTKAKAAAGLPLVDVESATKQELLVAAAAAGISGRTQMSKAELARALQEQ